MSHIHIQHHFTEEDKEIIINCLKGDFPISLMIGSDVPSAQPEIVRCRECKNWDKTWTTDWSPEYHYCPMIDGVRKGDFYCAHAERRTDE